MRLKATRSLGQLRVRGAAARIAEHLGHAESNLRKESAAALGEIADPSVAPDLERATRDDDPEVRKNARWALARTGG